MSARPLIKMSCPTDALATQPSKGLNLLGGRGCVGRGFVESFEVLFWGRLEGGLGAVAGVCFGGFGPGFRALVGRAVRWFGDSAWGHARRAKSNDSARAHAPVDAQRPLVQPPRRHARRQLGGGAVLIVELLALGGAPAATAAAAGRGRWRGALGGVCQVGGEWGVRVCDGGGGRLGARRLSACFGSFGGWAGSPPRRQAVAPPKKRRRAVPVSAGTLSALMLSNPPSSTSVRATRSPSSGTAPTPPQKNCRRAVPNPRRSAYEPTVLHLRPRDQVPQLRRVPRPQPRVRRGVERLDALRRGGGARGGVAGEQQDAAGGEAVLVPAGGRFLEVVWALSGGLFGRFLEVFVGAFLPSAAFWGPFWGGFGGRGLAQVWGLRWAAVLLVWWS